MKNEKKPFGALRATTLAALCAGGLMLMTACASDGAEKSCGEGTCGKSAEKSCGNDEKSCGGDEKSCGGDEKSCG
jgi:hypothetical protein